MKDVNKRKKPLQMVWIITQNEWLSSVSTPIFWYATCLTPAILLVVYFFVMWLIRDDPRETWLADESVRSWEQIIEDQLDRQQQQHMSVQHYAILDLGTSSSSRIRAEIERNDRYTFLASILGLNEEAFKQFLDQVNNEDIRHELNQFRRDLLKMRHLNATLPKVHLIEQILRYLTTQTDSPKSELTALATKFQKLWTRYRLEFEGILPSWTTNLFKEVIPSNNTERAVQSLLQNNEIVGYFVIPERINESNVKVSFVTLTDVSRAEVLNLVNWFRSVVSAVVQKDRLDDAAIESQMQYMLVYQTPEISSDLQIAISEVVELPKGVHRFVYIGLPLILLFIVLAATSRVISNVFEEKSSKLADSLLANVSPIYLLDGKLWGAALISLTVMFVWALIIPPILLPVGITEQRYFLTIVHLLLRPEVILNFVLFSILLYAFYGYIFVALASMFNTLNDAISALMLGAIGLTLPATLAMVVPFIPILFWQNVISFFPPISPFVMVARSGALPSWPTYLAIVVVMVSSVIAVRLLSRGMFIRGISSETRISWTPKKSRRGEAHNKVVY